MELFKLLKILYLIRLNAKSTMKRNFSDFVKDKIIQAATEKNLLLFTEKFSKLLNVENFNIHDDDLNSLIELNKERKYLLWIRKYPQLCAMIISMKLLGEIEKTCEKITIDNIDEDMGCALPQGKFDINIEFTTLTPLAHGSDIKAGNATLFRRMQIITNKNITLELPFYAGNAFRGQLRDLLADNFLHVLDIENKKDNPLIALWFFYLIYSGGSLDSNAESIKILADGLGKNGMIIAEGISNFRKQFPFLSLLGCGLGNRILSGRINVSDFRPQCSEWGNGKESVENLFDWIYLTRREDYEGHKDGENSSMIANIECIKAGIKFTGGIDYHNNITDLEKSALGVALKEFTLKNYIGADNRRGLGKIDLRIINGPDPMMYENYLIENKVDIVNYLNSLKVI